MLLGLLVDARPFSTQSGQAVPAACCVGQTLTPKAPGAEEGSSAGGAASAAVASAWLQVWEDRENHTGEAPVLPRAAPC